MNSSKVIPINSKLGNVIDDDRPVLVEPGRYEVVLVNTKKGYLFGKIPKVSLTFRIMTVGPHYGKHLKRWYNVKGFSKKKEVIPGSWSCDLVREYSRFFGMPIKLRQVGLKKFGGKIFLCQVRTVKNNYKQKQLHENNYYSVIEELIEIAAG